MTEQQQIEEMETIAHNNAPIPFDSATKISVAFYAAGYRKQSETVIEFVERLKKRLKVFCSDDREYKFTFEGIAWNLDELAAEFGAEAEE